MASRIPSEWRTVDYYAELGVAKDATFDEVSRRYRALAKQLHPDMQPGDPGASARFARVSTAHEVLADPTRRHDYDVYRRSLVRDHDTPREPRFRTSATIPEPTRFLTPEPPPQPPERAKGGLFGFFGEFAGHHPFALGAVVLMMLILIFTALAGPGGGSDGASACQNPPSVTIGGTQYDVVPAEVVAILPGEVQLQYGVHGEQQQGWLVDSDSARRHIGDPVLIGIDGEDHPVVRVAGCPTTTTSKR